ncbi:hypothetical protein [Ekhidna sp.]|uniref:hypothetical protein n=1 Tax=Ekhidna sp. TaxID=2608089 RepID=UPI003510FF36
MKKSLILILASALFSISFAQEATEKRSQREFEISYDDMDQVKVSLNLSDEQLQKWNQVNDKYYPNLKELEQQDSLDFRTKSIQLKKIMEDRDAELKEFVFAAQWDKYQNLKMQARREGMKSRREEMMQKRKEMMEKRKQGQKEGDGGDQ